MGLEGRVLRGRYRVEVMVGKGGVASVFQAQDLALGGRPVAIKRVACVEPDATFRAEAQRHFEAEALLLSRLDHPGLVSVVDFFVDDESGYLVMPFINGATLENVVSATPADLPVPAVVSISIRLLEVMEYLHSRPSPVLFRDLKPGNVMLDSNGHLRIIDFGLSRRDGDGLHTMSFLQGAGTPGYAPPEQYDGRTDVRSDLYAFGATLYTMLTRRVPPSSVALLVREADLVLPRSLNPATPEPLEAVILECMAMRREERPASARDVRARLDVLVTPEVQAFPLHTLLPRESGGIRPQEIVDSLLTCPYCSEILAEVGRTHCRSCGGLLPSLKPGEGEHARRGLADSPTVMASPAVRPSASAGRVRQLAGRAAVAWRAMTGQVSGRLSASARSARRPSRLVRGLLVLLLLGVAASVLWEMGLGLVTGSPSAVVNEFLDACEARDSARATQVLHPPIREAAGAKLDGAFSHEVRLSNRRVELASCGRDKAALRVSFGCRYKSGAVWRDVPTQTWAVRVLRTGTRWGLLDVPWPLLDLDESGPGWVRLWDGHLFGLSLGKNRDEVWISLKKSRAAAFCLPVQAGSSQFVSSRANWAYFKSLMQLALEVAGAAGSKPFDTDGTIHFSKAQFRVVPSWSSRTLTIEILEDPGGLPEVAVVELDEYDKIQRLIQQMDGQVGTRSP